MKILVLGKKGMVAHIMALYLKEQGHKVTSVSLRDRDLRSVKWFNNYDLVINCVGILVHESLTDMDMAVLYNSYLPHFLEKIYEATNTKVIQISTDCIYDADFYGRTKALGEIENKKDLTLRMSVIGPDLDPKGGGLFNWFMHQKGEVGGYEHAIWNGITTLELAKSIEKAKDLVGIYNLVPEEGISKFELLKKLNIIFDRGLIVTPIEQGRDKTLPAGDVIELPDYETMFKEMKEWINEHPKEYSHYIS